MKIDTAYYDHMSIQDLFTELTDRHAGLYGAGNLVGPMFSGRKILVISLDNEFEVFTNECWDLVWKLQLLTVRHFTKMRYGWTGSDTAGMTFRAKNLRTCLIEALHWMDAMMLCGLDIRLKELIRD